MTSLREGPTTVVRREDYAAPAFWIDSVDLTFDLDPAKTRVLNRMRLRRNPDVAAQPLRLDGEDLNLARVLVNGGGCSFKMDGGQLVLENLPEGSEPIDLEIFTTCNPAKNTQLMGLYVSQGTFFTQCEAEGFRRITYFLDRPDVMASYTVTLRADKAKYPVLLSNGNLVEEGTLPDGRHFASIRNRTDNLKLCKLPARHFDMDFIKRHPKESREHRGILARTDSSCFIVSEAKVRADAGLAEHGFDGAVEDVHEALRVFLVRVTTHARLIHADLRAPSRHQLRPGRPRRQLLQHQ